MRKAVTAVTAVILLGGTLVAASPATAGFDRCQPVTVAARAANDETRFVSGTHCRPRGWNRTTLVFVAGAGYLRSYWESLLLPIDRWARQEGFATITFDPIGRGRSGVLPGSAVTLQVEAHVVDLWVGHARNTGARRVITIGHSHGAAVVIEQAATGRHPVNRIALQGFLHGARNGEVGLNNEPATNQPDLFPGLDAGWSTAKRGHRSLFFHLPVTPKWVLDRDERTKSVASATSLGGYIAQQSAPAETNLARRVAVPVGLFIGQYDSIFCRPPAPHDCTDARAVQRFEDQYFSSAPYVRVWPVSAAGHSLNGQPNPRTWTGLRTFIR